MPPSFFLVVWFGLPVLLWLVTLCIPGRLPTVLVCLLCLGTMVLGNYAVVHHVRSVDAYLEAEMGKYEQGTPEAKAASEAWASDAGRSFALAFSAQLTAICYTAAYLLLFAHRWIFRLLFPPQPTPTRAEPGSVESRPDDGNPYQPPLVE